jgi:threonine dehydrogenase-like Zn-dependent dehydrogenase
VYPILNHILDRCGTEESLDSRLNCEPLSYPTATAAALARRSGAETLDFTSPDLQEQIKQLTNGDGPDGVIEALGLESHGHGGIMETVKSAMRASERAYALEQAILACRPGGIIAQRGVFVNTFPVAMGAVMAKALTLKAGQTHMQKYLASLMNLIADGKIDHSFIITDRISLEVGPDAYVRFRDKKDGCIKVVIKPHG